MSAELGYVFELNVWWTIPPWCRSNVALQQQTASACTFCIMGGHGA